ncbi:MAG: hypothetical protein K9K38_16005 [Rhodoferax sp.]|nr:hypothetical protein [Rhodoferax sp.]MCF8210881.1 hypothetical protein [Rhodoferax sp.]
MSLKVRTSKLLAATKSLAQAGGVVGAVSALAACALVDERAMWLVSTSAPAILLVNGQVLVGSLNIRIDHTGSLSVAHAVPEPVAAATGPRTQAAAATAGTGVQAQAVVAAIPRVSCVGQFRFVATTAGTVDVRCSDGTTAVLNVALLSERSGYGYGPSAGGPVSLTFGLEPQAAKAYLQVPPGKRLHELPKSPFFEVL